MKKFLQLAYFAFAIMQLFAVWNSLEKLTGMEAVIFGILSFLVSAIVSVLPFVGSVFGMFGAVYAWDWSWLQAALVFFSLPAVVIIWTLGDRRWDGFRR